MSGVSSSGPLAGLVILDLSVALAGPLVTFNFASMGATVLKVESPGGSDIGRANPPYAGSRGLHNSRMEGDDISISMMDRSRGKRSVTLDLKQEEGHRLFLELAAHADVVIENMSSGTAERLGVGYEDICAVNDRIIYCSISAFGETEEYRGVKGMDILIQAASGVMSSTGFADGPPVRVGIPIGDIFGSMYAGMGILAALRERDRSGKGDRVDISLLDCLVAMVAEEHFDAEEIPADSPVRSGNMHNRLAPFGAYPAADGHVALAAPSDVMVASLFRAIDRPELIDDVRFDNRGARAANSEALNELLTEWFSTRPVRDIIQRLHKEFDVPVVEVRDPRDAVGDPEHLQSGAVTELFHPTLGDGYGARVLGTGFPVRFSRSTTDTSKPPPILGSDTAEILSSMLGLSDEQLETLRQQRVI